MSGMELLNKALLDKYGSSLDFTMTLPVDIDDPNAVWFLDIRRPEDDDLMISWSEKQHFEVARLTDKAVPLTSLVVDSDTFGTVEAVLTHLKAHLG